jgi:hypothetical protein
MHREARCRGVAVAVVLVQSFDARDASFNDYRTFAEALGVTRGRAGPADVADALVGISLRLGWARSRLAG